ncbi:MAG: glycosyltransferase, partial [Planctomyces sp.]
MLITQGVVQDARHRGCALRSPSPNQVKGLRPLPFVSCLCPTYRRPQMMANTISCFITQDYPADRRELIILDDAGELNNETGDGWQIISISRRFRSLPEKVNALAGLAQGDILVVWEDDDIYLQHHISTHVRAMEGR